MDELCGYLENFVVHGLGSTEELQVKSTIPTDSAREIGTSGRCTIRSSTAIVYELWILTGLHFQDQVEMTRTHLPHSSMRDAEFWTINGTKVSVRNEEGEWDFETLVDGWAASLVIRQNNYDQTVMTVDAITTIGEFVVQAVEEFRE
ncbi:hypothetical protein EF834_04940 [Rhodococcus spongiicola]|uniref:Uncharacterized protein n=1 Tax=Rhodococcus spongiicola TaxID=2487352 RepID=A0A438B0I7_9NOCA|nr:hypothetical protein EF834_04940 [Rhodococcus spongiicola]